MTSIKSNGGVAASLLLTTLFWGVGNAGTKYVLSAWPPLWVGATRFLCAGLLLLALAKWTNLLGQCRPITPQQKREFWLRGGLSLAIYVVVFNVAMHLTSAGHVALYLGTSPVWALIWEERPKWNLRSAQRYGAALLASSGVIALFWPTLRSGTTRWVGELLGIFASFMWAHYGRQCRACAGRLTGTEVSAHTVWRAGAWLTPFALVEIVQKPLVWKTNIVLVQLYCIIGGGVLAYAFWNNALALWPTSKVYLFNNLIPITTMTASAIFLGEKITQTFWIALCLIVLGVILGQSGWQRFFGKRWIPE